MLGKHLQLGWGGSATKPHHSASSPNASGDVPFRLAEVGRSELIAVQVPFEGYSDNERRVFIAFIITAQIQQQISVHKFSRDVGGPTSPVKTTSTFR
jgi:hypothetical protein